MILKSRHERDTMPEMLGYTSGIIGDTQSFLCLMGDPMTKGKETMTANRQPRAV